MISFLYRFIVGFKYSEIAKLLSEVSELHCMVDLGPLRQCKRTYAVVHHDNHRMSEVEEADYEGEDEAAVDDALRDDEESRVDSQGPREVDQERPLRRQQSISYNDKKYMQPLTNDHRNTRANTDIFSELKRFGDKSDDTKKSHDNIQTKHQSNRYIESSDTNDQSEMSQHLTNRDVNNYKANRIQPDVRDNKLPIQSQAETSDEADALFENRENGQVQLNEFPKNEFNNEPVDSNEPSHFLKQYYNTMQTDNKGTYEDKSYDNLRYKTNRDRREIEDTYKQDSEIASNLSNNKDSVDETTSENEESAIKRHIKKLSGEELEELLNSLSDDKRVLLNKIMENDQNYESISKREITKKAGAVEVNGYLENGISDTNKLQGYSALSDSTESVISQNTDTTENTKEPEISEIATIKNTNQPEAINSKRELTSTIDEVKQSNENSNDCSSTTIDDNQAHVELNTQAIAKNENKREASVNDLSNIKLSFDDTNLVNDLNLKDSQDASNEQNYLSAEDEDLSQVMDDEAQFYNPGHNNKRDIYLDNQMDLSDSIKSLEDSFPNGNGYDESSQYSESNMVPLVRVKRKNEEATVQKRAAALLPDVKVAYFPYRAENDDEDNDEGNEFEDDGFYDRTSNYAKNNDNDKPSDDSNNAHGSKSDHSNLPVNGNTGSDTSLGSDTDSVLSGVEGVDDNLMYNSGTRNRRIAQDNSVPQILENVNRSLRSTPQIDDELQIASENVNVPSYQENDAFGPLQRNYEGM
ncbi:uncharacterized protein ACR2FA_002728 [Aphomia sociella]